MNIPKIDLKSNFLAYVRFWPKAVMWEQLEKQLF